MDQLFCGARSDLEPWDPLMLRQAIHPDHGYVDSLNVSHSEFLEQKMNLVFFYFRYTHDSPQIHWLVQVLSQYDENHRRLFLQFITGSPRLPVGGERNCVRILLESIKKMLLHRFFFRIKEFKSSINRRSQARWWYRR